MKPQQPRKRQTKRRVGSARATRKRLEPQFDHKTDGVSRLPSLLTDWFGAHNASAEMDAVSSGHDGRFASQRLGAAKGRQ